ncbi:hypothetical protein CSHISOI_05132, partial [Colletotrichum shisoi]
MLPSLQNSACSTPRGRDREEPQKKKKKYDVQSIVNTMEYPDSMAALTVGSSNATTFATTATDSSTPR